MRSLHRWLTTVFSIVLLFLAVTGLLIQGDDLLALAGLGPHPAREMAGINGGAAFMDPNFPGLGPGNDAPSANQTPLTANPAPLLATALAQLPAHAQITQVLWKSLRQVPQFTFNFSSAAPLTINALTGAIIPQPPSNADASGQSFHDFIKAFHNGSVAAAPGVWLLFCTGLSLLLLSLSGLWVYAKMWLARRSLGRSGLLWSGAREPLLWRRLHRHVSLFAAIFLAYVAVTGMLLSLDDIVVRFSAGYPPAMLAPGLPGGGGPPPMAPPAPLNSADLATQFSRVRAAIAAVAPNRAPLSIKISSGQDAAVIASGRQVALYQFNPATGAWTNPKTAGVPDVSPYVGSLHWHQILKRLHRGDIIGLGGRWLIVLSDLCLLYLSVSGIVMYFQMLARRRQTGRPGWFW